MLTVLALGGAVAGVYTTGVTLGSRLAGPPDGGARDEARPRSGAGDADVDDSGTEGTGADDVAGAWPDRATGPGTTGTTGPPRSGSTPGRSGSGDPDGGASTAERPRPPTEPYRGLWPYASWDEARQHRDRGDGRFVDAATTALQFAREVVGLTDPTVGTVDERGTDATVEVRAGDRVSVVSLTRAVPDGTVRGAPWSVTAARGPVSLDAPSTVTGATVSVTATGSPGVVGVRDRRGWRGIGVAPAPGAPVEVRLDPGAAGPAMVVAFDGDPRDPVGFTVDRAELAAGAGAAAPGAPVEPLAATQALVAATRRGDVGAVWELLAPTARAAVLDWRGLAGRLPALRDGLGLFARGTASATAVATAVGPVTVVAPAVALSAEVASPLAALAFVSDGAARLAALEPASVSWSGPEGADGDVVAAGRSRPVALVVDGAVWAAAPDGARGLRASTAGLPVGGHVAVAVVVAGDRVAVSAHLFGIDAPAVAGPPTTAGEPPPTTTRSGAEPTPAPEAPDASEG